jgi:hypothetical protein
MEIVPSLATGARSPRRFVVRTLERLGLNVEAVKPGPGRPPRPASLRQKLDPAAIGDAICGLHIIPELAAMSPELARG